MFKIAFYRDFPKTHKNKGVSGNPHYPQRGGVGLRLLKATHDSWLLGIAVCRTGTCLPTLLTPLTLHQRIAAKYVNTARLRLGARFRHRALLLQRRNLEDLCFLDVLAVDRLPGTTGLTFVESSTSKRMDSHPRNAAREANCRAPADPRVQLLYPLNFPRSPGVGAPG